MSTHQTYRIAGRWRSAVLLLSGFCGLAAMPSHAQTVPGQYQISARLTPARIGSTTLVSRALFLNEQGDAGGFADQAAGYVWRYFKPDPTTTPFPLSLFTAYQKVNTVNGYPVIWAGGVPKVAARYKPTTSTWLMDFAGDDTWLLAVAPKAGPVEQSNSVRLVGAQEAQTPNQSQLVLATNGRYSAIPSNTFTSGARVFANARGTVAGRSFKLPAHSAIWRGGKVEDIAYDTSAGFRTTLLALNDSDDVLVRVTRDGIDGERCFLWQQGRFTEVLLPESGQDQAAQNLVCAAMNNTGTVAGFVVSEQIVSGEIVRHRAVFRWRSGQAEVSAFKPETRYRSDSMFGRMFIDEAGLLAFNGNGASYLYAGGDWVPLAPLIKDASAAALPDSRVLDMNRAGQILWQPLDDMRTGTAAGMPVVISPVR